MPLMFNTNMELVSDGRVCAHIYRLKGSRILSGVCPSAVDSLCGFIFSKHPSHHS